MAKVSMQLIADRLGVSKNTVSVALRNLPGVSSEVRSRVVRCAQDLGYHQQVPEERGVALVMSEAISPGNGFYEQVISGIEMGCSQLGWHCSLYWQRSDREPSDLVPRIGRAKPLGILLLGSLSQESLESLRKLALPIVSIDHDYQNSDFDSIGTDNVDAGFQASHYLQGRGITDLGFCGSLTSSPSFCDRYLGFLKAKLDLSELFLIKMPKIWKDEEALRKELVLPQGILCANDFLACRVIQVLEERGVLIPDQVSVMGIDDISLADLVRPKLTTMKVGMQEMGTLAVKLLQGRLQSPQSSRIKILLPSALIVRQSTP